MSRLDKMQNYLKLGLTPNNLLIIGRADKLMEWNMMERKPAEVQIIRQSELSARQRLRESFREAVDEFAKTPELRFQLDVFRRHITEQGNLDINDLPVDKRLWLTREGIIYLTKEYTKLGGSQSMIQIVDEVENSLYD